MAWSLCRLLLHRVQIVMCRLYAAVTPYAPSAPAIETIDVEGREGPEAQAPPAIETIELENRG